MVIFNSYVKLTEGTLIFVLGCGPACHYDWFSTADHDDFFSIPSAFLHYWQVCHTGLIGLHKKSHVGMGQNPGT